MVKQYSRYKNRDEENGREHEAAERHENSGRQKVSGPEITDSASRESELLTEKRSPTGSKLAVRKGSAGFKPDCFESNPESNAFLLCCLGSSLASPGLDVQFSGKATGARFIGLN